MTIHGYAEQLLEIQAAGHGGAGSPAEGDLLLNVTVQVGGYSAVEKAWVVKSSWAEFMAEVR